MFKTLVSDYDGTLYINSVVSDVDIKAIHEFKALGHHFGIATGRSLGSILEEIAKYNIPFDFVIANNGAISIDSKGKILHKTIVDLNVVHDVLESLTGDHIQFFGLSDGISVGLHDTLNKNVDVHVNQISLNEILSTEEIVGMYIKFIDEASAIKHAAYINQTYPDQLKAYSFHEYNDILSPNTSKASGIVSVVKALDLHEVVHTVGDSFNDIPMTRMFAGYGISSGEEKLLKEAFKICDSVSEVIMDLLNSD
ncbi:MAG: HAD family hydrolase [Erysipelotrichaceae bacterium]|nr:HAD family hydrolase [Erysipelotrichaceae bacterium]